MGGVETHIGDLVLTSELTSSNWGDKHLFFRHQVVFSCLASRKFYSIVDSSTSHFKN